MKPLIPKHPLVPDLKDDEIAFLTKLTFGEEIAPKQCDALFVFSGTHKGHWEKAIEAYQRGFAHKIIVTGGRSLTGVPHPEWEGTIQTNCSEAHIIVSYLLKAGVPSNCIVYEEKSTNTLENVRFAKDLYDFSSVDSLMVVCKSHAAGRQIRTLMKHLPLAIDYVPFTFHAEYQGVEIRRDNWMNTDIGKKRVWGEYLRIETYGKMGHLVQYI